MAPAIGSYYFSMAAVNKVAQHMAAHPLAGYRLVPVSGLPSKAPPPQLTVNLPPNATQAQRMQVCWCWCDMYDGSETRWCARRRRMRCLAGADIACFVCWPGTWSVQLNMGRLRIARIYPCSHLSAIPHTFVHHTHTLTLLSTPPTTGPAGTHCCPAGCSQRSPQAG